MAFLGPPINALNQRIDGLPAASKAIWRGGWPVSAKKAANPAADTAVVAWLVSG